MRGGTSALHIAVLSFDHESIQTLLDHGAEVDLINTFRLTPLMYAAGMSGNGRGPGNGETDDIQELAIKTIDLLLDAGADINARVTDSHTFTAKLDTYIQRKENEGRSSLFAAAEIGWEKVVAHLLERGADPTFRDIDGLNALDAALAPARTGPGARREDVTDRQATAALLSAALAE
jgi:ankyrin repeat protein